MTKFKIKYFFRKPSEVFHSIEELFQNFQQKLPKESSFDNVYLLHHTGFIGRIKNIFFVKKHKSDINHITGDVNYIALGLPKKNTIITIHDIGSTLTGSNLKIFIIKLFWYKIPLKRATKITVISEFSKNELLKTFKIDPRKIIVIPNCVSDKFQYQQKEFNEKKPNILIVGTKENKNLTRSLEALKDIQCKVTIIGKLKTSQKKKLEELNTDYENLYNIDYKDIIENYQAADMLLFPTIYEGFGIPILEAQATGIPLLTSNLQPMNQIAGYGAMLVNPFNSNDIKKGVQKIIEDKEYRTEIINKGLENVKKYRCEEIAKRYYAIYQEVYKND